MFQLLTSNFWQFFSFYADGMLGWDCFSEAVLPDGKSEGLYGFFAAGRSADVSPLPLGSLRFHAGNRYSGWLRSVGQD